MNRVAFEAISHTESWPSTYEPSSPSETSPTHKSVFVPLKYEPTHAYPLVVWLHDDGEDESAMRRIIPRVSLRNFIAIGVRGTAKCESTGHGYVWHQTINGIPQAMHSINSQIKSIASRYQIAPQHIFIAGAGTGGTMALRVAYNFPEQFAGCASLGGAFPRGLQPLKHVNRARGLQVMMTNSDAFPDYPTASFCEDLRLMYYAGSKVLVREYESGDDVYRPILSDLNRWMMGIVTRQFLFEPHEVVCDTSNRN